MKILLVAIKDGRIRDTQLFTKGEGDTSNASMKARARHWMLESDSVECWGFETLDGELYWIAQTQDPVKFTDEEHDSKWHKEQLEKLEATT